MLSIANSSWEITSLFLVFVFGAGVVAGMCKALSFPYRTGLLIYLWHSVFCLFYIYYSISNPADSVAYYVRSIRWAQDFALGTQGVTYLTSIMTQWGGLSYGGAFFVYNIFGAIGLLAVAATLRDAAKGKGQIGRLIASWLPFLPGLSFWSVAIGKDSIAFFGVGLACWAAASPYRRFIALGVAFAALVAVRPHMAAFMIIGLAAGFAVDRNIPMRARVVVSAMSLPMALVIVTLSLSYVGLSTDVTGAELSAYVEDRQSYNTAGGSSVDIASASVPVRLFTYVFRPLFFDAGGALGLVVSFENLVLLGLLITAGAYATRRRSNLSRFQVVFYCVYCLLSWVALANTTSNLGIAIRQKEMFVPMLLVLGISYFPRARAAPVKSGGMPIKHASESIPANA